MTSSISPVCEEMFSDNAVEFWSNEIDKLTVEKILQEKHYLLCSVYKLENFSFRIECGISGARSFEPAIKLVTEVDDTNISFDETEWYIFTTHLRAFINQTFKTTDEMEKYFINLASSEQVKLQGCNIMGNKVLKVTSLAQPALTSFYLSEQLIEEVLRLNALLVRRKVETLHRLNFLTFYNNFIGMVRKLVFQSNYELSAETVASAFCDILTDSVESYCMRECYFYYKTQVLEALQQYVDL